jgi:hypothetical protein
VSEGLKGLHKILMMAAVIWIWTLMLPEGGEKEKAKTTRKRIQMKSLHRYRVGPK